MHAYIFFVVKVCGQVIGTIEHGARANAKILLAMVGEKNVANKLYMNFTCTLLLCKYGKAGFYCSVSGQEFFCAIICLINVCALYLNTSCLAKCCTSVIDVK